MKDDYLWDGSGEPDPDIEKLESLLGRYRSERPAPELPETPVVPFRPRRAVFVRYAAAAAVVALSLFLGLWLLTHLGEESRTKKAEGPTGPVVTPKPAGPVDNQLPTVPEPPKIASGGQPKIVRESSPRPTTARRPKIETQQPAPAAEPKFRPLVDVATAAHIEQTEILLRSFRNASADDDDAVAEVAFDSEQSRQLLDQNMLLRRAATTKKNLVASQLLSDIEPYLIDIASLGDKPSRDDVREIQQRLEQREIVSDLQLYSMNRPTQGF